jgi:hypothetical protein
MVISPQRQHCDTSDGRHDKISYLDGRSHVERGPIPQVSHSVEKFLMAFAAIRSIVPSHRQLSTSICHSYCRSGRRRSGGPFTESSRFASCDGTSSIAVARSLPSTTSSRMTDIGVGPGAFISPMTLPTSKLSAASNFRASRCMRWFSAW